MIKIACSREAANFIIPRIVEQQKIKDRDQFSSPPIFHSL